jgi:hypothetical protein
MAEIHVVDVTSATRFASSGKLFVCQFGFAFLKLTIQPERRSKQTELSTPRDMSRCWSANKRNSLPVCKLCIGN